MLASESNSLFGPHHGVEEAAEKGEETRPLVPPEVADGGEHLHDLLCAANATGVDLVVYLHVAGALPVEFRVIEGVGRQSFLADGVLEHVVEDLSAPGEIVGGGLFAIQA